jgi:hypothetical protein
MNKKLFSLLYCCLFLFGSISLAQKNVVNVNLSTGAPNVVIPLYTIHRGMVSLPISLVYSSLGIKPRDVEGSAGMGWQLEAGGAITRIVRGLPDDVMQDNWGNSRLGWMYNTKQTSINNFTPIANDNNPSTCGDASSDINYITSNFADLSDTEPDIFYINAPGLSAELIWDQISGQFKPVGYQDIKITYSANGTGVYNPGEIRYFIITNDKGVKYQFSAPDQVIDYTSGTPTYFTTKNSQYHYGITYYTNWRLTSIFDANNNGVILNYSVGTQRSSSNPVNLYLPGNTTATFQYNFSETTTPQLLIGIQETYLDNTVNSFALSWNNTVTFGTGINYINTISGFGRDFQFNYTNITYTPTSYIREFLTSFTDLGSCNSPINYSFSYIGVNTSARTTILPDSTTAKQDYWGYYNAGSGTSLMPKMLINATTTSGPQYSIYDSHNTSYYPYYTTNGNIRSADTVNVMTGSLNKVTYAEGGSTTLVYQSNDYLDAVSGAVIKGGGIRVKQLIDSVSTNSTNNIIRNYIYNDPSTGLSSGKPVTLPAFGFSIPYGGSSSGNALYNLATIVSDYDLSDEDHSILYKYVRVSEPGVGYTQYQYYLPATNWDLSATPGCNGCTTADWGPTVNYIQAITCGSTIGPILNNTSGYPFTPNRNYDFERGLLQKVSSYNSLGYEVNEDNYTYQRLTSPSYITGFKGEDLPYASGSAAVKSYSKYNIYYKVAELALTTNTKIFDSNNQNTSSSTTVSYTYGSTNHKLLTSQSATNSDNSTLTTNYLYTKDLTAASGSNPNVTALYNLQQANINVPVETWQQVTRSGTTLTTGASLTLFNTFTTGGTQPSQSYKLVQPAGLSGFVPVNVTGQAMSYNSNYFLSTNFTAYDTYANLQTADNAHNKVQSAITDNIAAQPVIMVSSAAASEIVFANFDGDMNAAWTGGETGTLSFTPPSGSHTGNSAGLGTNQGFSYTLTRNANAANYVFSIWINAAASGTLSASVNGGTAITIGYAGNNAWTYYEKKIPVSGLTSPLTLSFNANTNIGVDDIIFYPENAEVMTFAYDPTTHFKTAQTNTNGVSAYYTYDQWGRLLLQMDQDKNIVLKKSYVTTANIKAYKNITPAIYGPNTGAVSTPVTFSGYIYDACSGEGVTYNWTFGDGGTAQTTSATAPAHSYTAAGTYTVGLTVTSALFGSKVAPSVSITISAPMATITENNYTVGGGIGSITVTSTGYSQTYTGGSGFPAQIPPGTYTITFTPSGQAYNSSTGKGMTNVVFSDGANGLCFSYGTGGSHSFSWTVNAGDTLNFSVYNNNTCPFN